MGQSEVCNSPGVSQVQLVLQVRLRERSLVLQVVSSHTPCQLVHVFQHVGISVINNNSLHTVTNNLTTTHGVPACGYFCG